MTLCVVTDIDGTIAERLRVSDRDRGGWESAIKATPPAPIIPMRTLLQAAAQGGLPVIYATARRRSALRETTMTWLRENVFPMGPLYMREDDQRLAADVLKVAMLREIRNAGYRPVVWFEDEVNTVDALRLQGVHAITC